MNRPIIPPAKTVLYGTPQFLYCWMDQKFGPFTYDPCPLNDAKIWDSLAEQWSGIVYVNPPYGAKAIPNWLVKRFEPSRSVWLLPARTDTKWWHEWVLVGAKEIHWCRHRVTFLGMKHPAPFPSVVLVFEQKVMEPRHFTLDVKELERSFS